ncbi:MAG: hypothetical protein WCR69_03350 [Sulfuricurvum sp.]
MKKATLTLTLLSQVLSANIITLYSDPLTGQIFSTPAEGRVKMGDFMSVDSTNVIPKIDPIADLRDPKPQDLQNSTPKVASKANTLEFSGVHYFGFSSARAKNSTNYADDSSGFESRRNYLQVKGYLSEKDYFRVTLDATKALGSNTSYADVFIKYAYLYFDEILPHTSVEFGVAHRPWIDYEEHNSWFYRSFNRVAIEGKASTTGSGVDLLNSADLGVNFKIKRDAFSSEIGLFNGEGYHADKGGANQKNDEKLSLEWRLSGHIIGSGKDVGKQDPLKSSYAHLSTFGLLSKNHKDDSKTLDQTSPIPLKSEYDRTIFGLHTVYNEPSFLLAIQILKAKDKARNRKTSTNWGEREYDLLSINAEYRVLQDYSVVGRYDEYKLKDKLNDGSPMDSSVRGKKYIAALVYKYSQYVKFIASAKFIDEEFLHSSKDSGESKDVYMFTTEVKW